jgi:Kef-type K+ transport system membrane component KefB
MTNLHWLPSHPAAFIEGFAEVGIIAIRFARGFEESTQNFLRSIKRSWGIALFGALAPFFTAYWLSMVFWGDEHMALMVGLAMTATAVSLTMVSLRSEGLQNTPAATGIMTSAVLDDVASLAMVAVLVPIALGNTVANMAEIAWIMGKVVLFFVIVIVVSAWVFPHDIRNGWVARVPLLRDYGIHHLIWMEKGLHTTLVMMLVALVMGLASHAFGFHPAVGAYMAGLVLREEYFHPPGQAESSRYLGTKQIIDDVAFTWIGPVFFVTLGSQLVFDPGVILGVADLALILFLALFTAQIVSASLAARYTGGFSREESLMIGFGMLGRAELAMVVLSIAYVQNSIITKEVFYTVMLAATLLNIAVPVTIRWWKPRLAASMADAGDDSKLQ